MLAFFPLYFLRQNKLEIVQCSEEGTEMLKLSFYSESIINIMGHHLITVLLSLLLKSHFQE